MSDVKKGVHPTGGKVLTQQQFGHESSVGDLVARHRLGASIVDPSATRQPMFGDFTSVDFAKAQDLILQSKSDFARLPSAIRRRFMNSPEALLRFVENPANLDEAIKLGIVLDKRVKEESPKEMPKADPEANPHKKVE